MAGWVTLRQNTFDGTYPALTADPNIGVITAVELPGELTLTKPTPGNGYHDNFEGVGVYCAALTSGTLRRRWSLRVTGFPLRYSSVVTSVAVLGLTSSGSAAPTRGLFMRVWRWDAQYGISVLRGSGSVYQDLAAWTEADLPLVLTIEEQVFFTAGDASIHYHFLLAKEGTSGAPTVVYDSGVYAVDSSWQLDRVVVNHAGGDNSHAYSFTADYLLTEVYDDAGPTITPTPADGTNPISTTPELSYTTTDIAGVSAAAEVVTIDGETAWTGEAAQSGFTVTRTAISGGYQYVIRRTQPFTLGEVVSWTVHSEDAVGNVTESTFTFTCSTRTVAADLALQNGPRRLLFAKISGYEPILIQNVDPAPVGWSRSVLKCLMAPEEEWSLGLDLATMEVSPSSFMLELENIDDPDDETKKLFARLFAPGASCATGVHLAYLKDSGATQAWIEANATTIDADGAAAFTAPGTAHVGQETFSFTGVGAGGFTGCSRGLYPAVGSALGRKHKRPFSDSADGKLLISSVPYCWNGRMVALYLVTWDETVGNWHHDSEAVLLWVGRITDTIRYNPKRQTWQAQCEHILKDLDNAIGEDMPRGVLQGINLSGPQGLSFVVEELHDEATAVVGPGGGFTTVEILDNTATITVPAGFYADADDVAAAIQDALNAACAAWEVCYWSCGRDSGDKYCISGSCNTPTPGAYDERKVRLKPRNMSTGVQCHALRCLGIDPRVAVYEATTVGPGGYVDLVHGSDTAFAAYHPLDYYCNGEKCSFYGAYSGPYRFWASQGDYGTARAAFQIKGGVLSSEIEEGRYIDRYDGNGTELSLRNSHVLLEYVTLCDWATRFPGGHHSDTYVGQRVGDDPVYAEQIYLPFATDSAGVTHGPFTQLLYVLLSTGTAALNHATYDVLPMELGIGIPAAIVDVQSFLDADKDLAGNPAAVRDCYVTDKSESAKDRLLRECQLFGYFPSWDLSLSKLSLKRFMPRADTYVETLDGDVRADVDEWVEPECSTGAVINSWRLECNYNLDTEKYEMTDSVRDQNSRQSLGVTKSVEITHPGVRISEEYGRSTLKDLFLSRMSICGLPWQRCTTTLAPMMIARLSIGDWVQYIGDHHPDPFGSGAMTCTCLAMATNVYWSLGGDRRWTGRDDLLLCARYDALTQVPWAAAALVDIAADNGGWDSTNKRLTLVALQYGKSGDSDCGAAFSVGDMIRIRQINPGGYGPTAALEWGPIEVASTYETDGAQLLTLVAGTTLASWDATQEYVVEPAHYADAVAAQHSRNAWQADATTRLLGTADAAQRWG